MDLVWLKQTVDTKGRACPLQLAENCPGTRAGCAFWLEDIVMNDLKMSTRVDGCMYAFQYVTLVGILGDQMRFAKELDKVATEIAGVKETIQLASRGLAILSLGGHRRGNVDGRLDGREVLPPGGVGEGSGPSST